MREREGVKHRGRPVGERGEHKGMAGWIESSSGVGTRFGKLAVVAVMASGSRRS